jgi:hypothetical protein
MLIQRVPPRNPFFVYHSTDEKDFSTVLYLFFICINWTRCCFFGTEIVTLFPVSSPLSPHGASTPVETKGYKDDVCQTRTQTRRTNEAAT